MQNFTDLYYIIKILGVYLVPKYLYTIIAIITGNVDLFLKRIKSVWMDANPFTENYGKVRVADTFGNFDFIIKYKKPS